MQQYTLGNTDIKLSAVIMGTWQAGRDMWTDIDDNETHNAMRAAFDAGITTFDTAEIYGNGHSEKIVGNALADVRDKAVIATKVFPSNYAYQKVIQSCENSLKNLKTDYIDLYQIHWPPGSFGMEAVPLKETMSALVELKTSGKIRAIGVSNFDRNLIEQARQYGPIESLQPPYSLIWRMVEKQTAAYCTDNTITLLAYSSMAQGLLTGKIGMNHVFAPGDHRASNRLFKPENLNRIHQMLEKIQPIADHHNLTLGQLALAWIISHPNCCAIAGARNARQATQNAKAGNTILSPEQMSQMDEYSRIVTDHLDDNPMLWG